MIKSEKVRPSIDQLNIGRGNLANEEEEQKKEDNEDNDYEVQRQP